MDAEPKIVQFARLKGWNTIDLFHLERDGKHYLGHFTTNSGVDFGIDARGSAGAISRKFDLELENLLKGTSLYGHEGEYTVETTQPDASARKHVDFFDHPTWGIGDWDTKVEDAGEDEDVEVLEDFHARLKKQLSDWKGSANRLRVTAHRYWPTFHEMMVEALKGKHGGTIRLFRGLYRDQARDLLQGKPLELHPYSSWSTDIDVSKGFRGHQGDYWVIVRADVPVEQIALAPIDVPGYAPDPTMMRKMLQSEDEYIVHSKRAMRPGEFKIVMRTKKQVAATVAWRYLNRC